MAETVVVSGRGQITIPADMRKRLGIESGGTMTIEETSGGLLLKPSIQISVDLEVLLRRRHRPLGRGGSPRTKVNVIAS